MSMLEWAKREVEIASKRERGDKPENEWDYGCACYDSALKAFESLCGCGHSGMSIRFTQDILNRLIDGKPLTPIDDNEDDWNYTSNLEDGVKQYQCKRMSGLFKDVFPDGTVKYTDVNRDVAIDINTNIGWHSGLDRHIVNDLYPITMPYMPEKERYEVYFEELLTDRKNGDFDTKAILYILTPKKERVEVNRFFREPHEGEDPTYLGWVEIDREEFEERRKLEKERIKAESNEG